MANTYGYPVTREHRPWYEGRSAYIRGRSARQAEYPVFCHVLEKAAREEHVFNPANPWSGFPWLTMVIGSGALAIADEPGLNPASLAERVRHLVETDVQDPNSPLREVDSGPLLPSRAATFTEALVGDRMMETAGNRGDEGAWEVEPVAARLVLLASLLTSWYNHVRALTSAPLSRWDADEARLEPGSPAAEELPGLAEELLDPSLDLIEAITQDLEAGRTHARPSVTTAVVGLLGLIEENIGSRRKAPNLRLEHLRLLTEICWHFLLIRTSVYPGWTDLLLGLMLTQQIDEHDTYRRARPRYLNLRHLPDAVRDLVRDSTRRSWMLSAPDGDEQGDQSAGPRDHLFRTIANVLWAESDTRRLHRPKAPPATAFVTSFDVETEMGLWTTGLERLAQGLPATFNVVVPVHLVRHRESEEAEPCWMWGEVDPDPSLTWDEQLQAILTPNRWHLLSDDAADASRDRLLASPTIIHLSGCPLFALPDLADPVIGPPLVNQFRAVDIVSLDTERAEVLHAVTVDEYLALRQAEAEHFWHGASGSSSGSRRGRGLPKEFAEASEAHPRFWMAIGVPIGDPAVRHRLVAQITLLRFLSGSRTSGVAPAGASAADGPPVASLLGHSARVTEPQERRARSDVSGVVINRRVNDDEASLLYWLGFDVVRDNCQAFVGDIEHYVDHLRADPDDLRTAPQGTCAVTPTNAKEAS